MKSHRHPSLPLRRFGTLIGGGTPTSDDKNWNGSIPFITPPDLRPVTGGVVVKTDRFLTEEGAAAGSSVVPADSVLLSIRAPIGYVARTGMLAAFNQGCRAVLPGEFVDSRYLTYALVAAGPELESLGRGTTFMELSTTQMAALELPAPPLAEQRAIADYLDLEISRIDTLIANQQRLIEMLRERQDSVWAGHFETAQRRGRSVVIRRVIDSIVDGPFGSSLTSAHYSDEGARVIRLGNIGVNKFKEGDAAFIPFDYAEELKAHAAEEGDVVVAGLGDDKMPLGRAAVVPVLGPAIVKADCYRLRPNDLVSAEYLAWVMSAPHTRSQIMLLARGSTRARLNTKVVQQVEIPLPDRVTQDELVATSDADLAKIDTLITEAERFVELAMERRSSLITAAVAGQIDVRAVF